MKQLAGQISMYELLNIDETPEIPFEKQKKGVKGWVIRIHGIFPRSNGWPKDMVGVTTFRVILERDSDTDRHGRWQYAHCIEGGCKGDGWMGTPYKLYAKRPTWKELQEYVRRNCREPYDEIVFTYKDGHAMTHIGKYEEKGA